jgi:hypothetical protein
VSVVVHSTGWLLLQAATGSWQAKRHVSRNSPLLQLLAVSNQLSIRCQAAAATAAATAAAAVDLWQLCREPHFDTNLTPTSKAARVNGSLLLLLAPPQV